MLGGLCSNGEFIVLIYIWERMQLEDLFRSFLSLKLFMSHLGRSFFVGIVLVACLIGDFKIMYNLRTNIYHSLVKASFSVALGERQGINTIFVARDNSVLLKFVYVLLKYVFMCAMWKSMDSFVYSLLSYHGSNSACQAFTAKT